MCAHFREGLFHTPSYALTTNTMSRLNLILVAISVLYVAANADRVKYEVWYNTKCSGDPAYFQVKEPIGKCVRFGASSSKKTAADLKQTIYSGSKTCGGNYKTENSLKKACTPLMGVFSTKYTTITDAAVSEARSKSGNLVKEAYDFSDSCAVASDSYVEYTIWPATANGKCLSTSLGNQIQKWDSKKTTTTSYTKAGCKGTATPTAKDINKCLNTTKTSAKSEKFITSTVSSATVAFNAMYATLFAFIVAMNLLQ